MQSHGVFSTATDKKETSDFYILRVYQPFSSCFSVLWRCASVCGIRVWVYPAVLFASVDTCLVRFREPVMAGTQMVEADPSVVLMTLHGEALAKSRALD